MYNLLSGGKANYPIPNTLPATNMQAVAWLVNLNTIIAADFLKIEEKINRLQAIVRCDVLPWVYKGDTNYSKLFQILIGTIVDHPPTDSKLFIYIRCEKQSIELLDKSDAPLDTFKISIYSNINTDEHWLQLYQQKIETFRNEKDIVGATLNYNVINNTGCLYSILVAGKSI